MLTLDDVNLLSFNQSHQFWGDSLNFSVNKHIVIEGTLYDLDNTDGVTNIWQQLSNKIAGATDYDPIIINGYNFGAGRINSANFAPGIDVRTKKYNIDLTIFSSGNLFNMVGSDFTNVVLPNIHLTERFNENFDFEIAEDSTYRYKQDITVKYVKGGVITDPILAAQQLASGLFHSSPSYGFIDASHSGFYNSPGRRTHTESYNTITNECAFSENFEQPPLSGSYAVKFTQEINTNEEGITNLVEKGHIEGVLGSDLMAAAGTGLDIELSLAFTRGQGLLDVYVPGTLPLNGGYLTLQKIINQFTNSIDYTVQYSNDPRNQTFYTWEYTQEAARTNDCFYTVKENGSIHGFTHDCTRIEQYNNALSGWNIVQTGVSDRLNTYYNTITTFTNPLKYVSSNISKSIHAGQISYDYAYTDDTTYNISGAIKRTEIQVQDNIPTPLINRFLVGHVGEIAQDLGIVKEGKREISIRLTGKRRTLFDIYLEAAQTQINQLIPTGTDVFIDSCDYNFAPLDNTFDLNVGWIYFGPAGGIFV